MTITDDRTPEEKVTHPILVTMTDSFMSHWPGLDGDRGGTSYAAWACRDEDQRRVTEWVESRKDAKRVRINVDPWKPRGRGTAHIYVVGYGHPALSR